MRSTSTISLVSALVLLASRAQAAAPDVTRGATLFAQQCQVCHQTSSSTGGGEGPSLAGVVGRKAGSADYAYSQPMLHARLTWSPASLELFLTNPTALIPGTAMPLRVELAADRRDLIAYLATLRPGAPKPISPAAPSARPLPAARDGGVLTGAAAYGDWHTDAPGVRRHIVVGDLPAPYATPSTANPPKVVDRPPGATPTAPPGFEVTLFASGLERPRVLRVAPNGDVFAAESQAGRVRLLRPSADGARLEKNELFAGHLDGPFGIAFYPPGSDPRWVYVAQTNAVVRYPYRSGDLHARGAAETVVPRLMPGRGGHVTRDLAFSLDGKRLFVSVGSGSNVAEGMERKSVADAQQWEQQHGLGATWDTEENRADVLVFTPEGQEGRVFATGLRNCVGLAVQPGSGTLWCSTNERDGLGDDLVPDHITRVREGGFYGWPWYYLGDHEEPRLEGHRPDLAGKATVPDVLLQPHSASLALTFSDSFPLPYRGAFAAEHGSWNRARRTGYKVIRVVLDASGAPTGEYEDFLTGFVIDDRAVWGRPVGVAVARDGALLVSEDGNGTIWRVAASKKATR